MTRVAKAQRRADAEIAGGRFGDPVEATAFIPGVEHASDPWSVEDMDAGDALGPSPRAETADGDVVPPDLLQPLTSLVQRVFFPPPVGTGAGSVLLCAADGGADVTGTCRHVATVLTTLTSRTVCLVDTHASRWRDDGSDGRQKTSALFRFARPSGKALWQADDADAGCRANPRRWLKDLTTRFAHVVIDGAALSAGGTGPSTLALLSDGVVLVVDHTATRREAARNVAETLHASGARLLGVVLVNQQYPIPTRLYSLL